MSDEITTPTDIRERRRSQAEAAPRPRPQDHLGKGGEPRDQEFQPRDLSKPIEVKYEKQEHFLDEVLAAEDLQPWQVQSQISRRQWAVLRGLVRLFNFDATMKAEMVHFLFPQVADMTRLYLSEEMGCGESETAARSKGSNWTKEEGALNAVIFSLLRQTYLPLLIVKIEKDAGELE